MQEERIHVRDTEGVREVHKSTVTMYEVLAATRLLLDLQILQWRTPGHCSATQNTLWINAHAECGYVKSEEGR